MSVLISDWVLLHLDCFALTVIITHTHVQTPQRRRSVQRRRLIAPQTDMSMKHTRCSRCFGAISTLAPLVADSRTKSLSYYYLPASSPSCFSSFSYTNIDVCTCAQHIKSLVHPVQPGQTYKHLLGTWVMLKNLNWTTNKKKHEVLTFILLYFYLAMWKHSGKINRWKAEPLKRVIPIRHGVSRCINREYMEAVTQHNSIFQYVPPSSLLSLLLTSSHSGHKIEDTHQAVTSPKSAAASSPCQTHLLRPAVNSTDHKGS